MTVHHSRHIRYVTSIRLGRSGHITWGGWHVAWGY